MSSPASLKPTDKAIKDYYAALQTFAAHAATHEGATETAFSRLLAVTAKPHGWTLIPKKKLTVKGTGKHIYPDGTLEDDFYLPRGYWEAKDTDDDLDDEVKKKTARGYPLTNTVFEDTRRAALFQNGQRVNDYDLTKPTAVAELLNRFYQFAEPDIEGFHQAVEEFKERVPQLARGLVEKIKEAHEKNKKFQDAFASFFALCQTTLNPNIRREAVDEMLVQHLLTERVFRTIFHESDFVQKNVIAAEVEKVIIALMSTSFSRDAFLKSLDKFYKAIEKAAEEIEDFQEKQHFLNTVYERFFQGYSVKAADTHGIVYTPQPIVDFMCASVEEVLKTEFGYTLGHKDVVILDPCTGTGNFVVNLLRRVPGKDLPRVYKEQLFANEVMLLPYYIAAMNIEHAYYEKMATYYPFEGLCFVDTLDLAEAKQQTFEFFAEKNTERVKRQKKSPINVIIGNPPYNAWQLNENDNNKNRKYPVIERRVSQTYTKDSVATNKNALSDPYVKFFRWATDRLADRDGIVCFISNNSFVDQVAFDGMRKHLLRDFTRIYHLHLEGNVRENPKLSGTAYNVFGIQVGVGITIAVKSSKHTDRDLFFHRVAKELPRAEKLAWVRQRGTISGVDWDSLKPDRRNTWLVPAHSGEFDAFLSICGKSGKSGKLLRSEVIFRLFSVGVKTNRDHVVYDYHRDVLMTRVNKFIDDYNNEVDRYKRLVKQGRKVKVDDFVRSDKIKWSETLKANLARGYSASISDAQFRSTLFRPFCKQFLYFNDLLVERRYQFPVIFPTPESEKENRVLVVSDLGYRASTVSALIANQIVDLHLCASIDSHQCFPFYEYSEGGASVRILRIGPSGNSTATTRTRRLPSGTSSTTSTACCTTRATGRSSPTTSRRACRASRSRRTSGRSPSPVSGWPTCT